MYTHIHTHIYIHTHYHIHNVTGSSPASLNLARFLIAALVFIPLAPGIWTQLFDQQKMVKPSEEGSDVGETNMGVEQGKVLYCSI